MTGLSLFSLIILATAFFTAFYLNANPNYEFTITPPYHYVPGEFLSELNAFFFVFIFSLLFFGITAPIALGIEGLKWGSLYSIKAITFYDLAFIVPQVIVSFSAIMLGQGIISDYEGKAALKQVLPTALTYFLAAIALFFAIYLLKPLLAQFIS